MKRERYFQDELRKMFVSYAVIPVFVFTLVCGVIFMADAVNQAVKAVAISRGFLSPVGIEICCIPSFADIVIDGEYRTAIRFAVEPRGAAAIAPIVDAAAVH